MPRLQGVDMTRRNLGGINIDRLIPRPSDVWQVRYDKHIERLLTGSCLQPPNRVFDRNVFMKAMIHRDIEPKLRSLRLVPHLTERDDLVTQLLKVCG